MPSKKDPKDDDDDVIEVDEPELVSEELQELFLYHINMATAIDQNSDDWKAMVASEQKKIDSAKSKSISPSKMSQIHLHHETTQKTIAGSETKLIVLLAKHRTNKMLGALARASVFAGHARSKSKIARQSEVEQAKEEAAKAEKKANEAKKAANELKNKPINISNAVAVSFSAPKKKLKRSGGAERVGGVAEPIGVGNDAAKSAMVDDTKRPELQAAGARKASADSNAKALADEKAKNDALQKELAIMKAQMAAATAEMVSDAPAYTIDVGSKRTPEAEIKSEDAVASPSKRARIVRDRPLSPASKLAAGAVPAQTPDNALALKSGLRIAT